MIIMIVIAVEFPLRCIFGFDCFDGE